MKMNLTIIAATKADPDPSRHFLIHCRWCKWMFTGWQVMSLVVDNSDRRNLTPVDSPASQQLYVAITHAMRHIPYRDKMQSQVHLSHEK